MFDHHPEVFLYMATLFISFYYTLLKKFKHHMMILYFWLHTLSYFAFAFLFLFQRHLVPASIQQLALDTSYHNLPLYIFSALAVVITYILLDKLMKLYPISKILALSQINILFATTGYILLGDRVSTVSILGLSILFIGAMISGLQNFSFSNPLKSLKSYDHKLLKLSTIRAFFASTITIITFLCTARYNETTRHILHTLTKHMHIPFVTIAPLHFNVGLQLANFTFMFLFITYALKEKNLIISTMKKQYDLILPLAGLYTLHAYYYYYAFDLIEDKNYITAISKMYLPITLMLAYWIFKEKPSNEQVVGMTIIVIGSFITTFG